MSQYWSQRNTNARQHTFYGNGVPTEGPRGASGPAGPVGSRGPNGPAGRDGTYEFMLLDAIPSGSSTTRLYDTAWNVYGSADMLADPRAFKNIGTSLAGWGNYDSLSLNFRPGIYKVSLTCNASDTDLAFAFDTNRNNNIAYGNTASEEAIAGAWDVNRSRTVTFTSVLTGNTNFHFIVRTSTTIQSQVGIRPQILFEKIGSTDPTSGVDDQLHHPFNGAETDSYHVGVTIGGSINWTGYQAPPGTYHPQYPPRNIGTGHPNHNPGWAYAIIPGLYF